MSICFYTQCSSCISKLISSIQPTMTKIICYQVITKCRILILQRWSNKIVGVSFTCSSQHTVHLNSFITFVARCCISIKHTFFISIQQTLCSLSSLILMVLKHIGLQSQNKRFLLFIIIIIVSTSNCTSISLTKLFINWIYWFFLQKVIFIKLTIFKLTEISRVRT